MCVNSWDMDQVQQFFAFKISLALRSACLYILPVQLYKKQIIWTCTSNHRLPVEKDRWYSTPLNERLCLLYICNKGLIGDEFHYILKYSVLKEMRKNIWTQNIGKEQFFKSSLNTWPIIILNPYENCVYLFQIYSMLSVSLGCFRVLIP